VREPDVALFGFERLDAPEVQYLAASPLRRHASLEVSTVGAAAAARLALERVHAAKHEFVLHFDVDVINSSEFPWTNFPGEGGLDLNDVRDALRVFASQPNLAALVMAGYNPDLDADGQGARKLIDLLADALSTRLETTSAAAAGAADAPPASSVSGAAASEIVSAEFPPVTGSDGDSDRSAPTELPETTEPDTTIS
jgi:hypothetical protein